MTEEPPVKEARKPAKPRTFYELPDGTPLSFAEFSKFVKDMVRYHNGVQRMEEETTSKKGKIKKKIFDLVVVPDANRPLDGIVLEPGPNNPLCIACGLDQTGCKHPYLDYIGSTNPIATILVESISRKEDDKGSIAAGGMNSYLAGLVHKLHDEHGVSLEDIRWVPITRCASRGEKHPQLQD